MSDRDQINRRDFIVTTAGVAGSASALAGAALTSAEAQTSPPPGFDAQEPFAKNWGKPLREVVHVDPIVAAPELANDAVKERHRIYCHLLMKLMVRFWNGNKRGPLGSYPRRVKQMEAVQPVQPTQRYRGDMIENPDRLRVNWDRYVGHNIACVAIDGNGEIIDFDFNHNDFFRSSAEHAESRMVRRLFSLTDIFDSWKTGNRIGDRSRAFSLQNVTLYTSLESCAQCSGVMSLGGVKQVVYLQNDFTAYMIGNIMFNLANPVSGLPGAPKPIAASAVGLQRLSPAAKGCRSFCCNPGAIRMANILSLPAGASPEVFSQDLVRRPQRQRGDGQRRIGRRPRRKRATADHIQIIMIP
jgi:tRNA(Arg) A34 adenosine deaminase TadA